MPERWLWKTCLLARAAPTSITCPPARASRAGYEPNKSFLNVLSGFHWEGDSPVSFPRRGWHPHRVAPRWVPAGTDVDAALPRLCDSGSIILGHAHPEVVEAVCAAATRGTTYGAPCEDEVLLAEHVTAAYPGIDQVRCVSSGTEAVMSAIRLARGATGRDGIVKFSGCYHGHLDSLLVKAGSGLATFGVPSSAGIPDGTTHPTRVLELDDCDAVRELLQREGQDIAAVIIEPMPANNGLLLQRLEFLKVLREETKKAGALLIFDEVISGFRIARGGAAERYGITPDIVTFGKVIGGGLPVGGFDGPAETMAHLAPLGPVYQAGTLSGNPLAMASGLAT